MKTTSTKPCFVVLFLSLIIQVHAQDTRAFNQNASRSNHTRAFNQNASRGNHTRLFASNEWQFSLGTGYSFAPNSNEQTLFRGNGMATKMSAAYYFGQFGFNFSTGIAPGSLSDNAINEFIAQRKFQQLQPTATKSNPLNSYFLFGPSFQFGGRIVVNADLQGGLFINDPGSMSIRQQGVDRALYSFDEGDKKLFAGFGGNISIGYPISTSSQFFMSMEYLQSTSSVLITDPQQGITTAMQQNRDMQLINIGIGIKKSFGQPKKAGRDMGIDNDGSTTMKHAINTKGNAATNGRMMNQENCGPVTVKTTNPDGTVEERTFSCPQDAANYNNAAGNSDVKRIVHRDLAARNIISGRLAWVNPSNNDVGIITNNNIAAAARQTPNASFGEKVKIGIRETTSGKSKTLKQYGIILADQGNAFSSSLGSVNDNPLYSSTAVVSNPLYESSGASGDNPLFEGGARYSNPMFQGNSNAGSNTLAVNTNPLYQGNSNAGSNPMFEGKGNMSGAQNNPLYSGKGIQENGLAGITVLLIDRETSQTVASTSTTSTGDFFFANVPDGDYVVRLSGAMVRTKGYDLTANSKIDLLGQVQHSDEQIQLMLNTGSEDMQQKAGISTSRSNVRTKSISLIEADLDGDGTYESTRVMMGLSDGTVQDVTASARVNSTSSVKKVIVKGWDPVKKQAAADNSQNEYTISVDATDNVSLTNREANGSVKDMPVLTTVTRQRNVSQVMVIVDGTDAMMQEDQKIKTKSNIKNDRVMNNQSGDPIVMEDQKIKTKSNIKNDRVMNNQSGEPIVMEDQKIKTKSNIKNDRMMSHSDQYTPQGISGYSKILNQSIADLDGDGVAETLVSGALPGGAVISAALMRPGTPIGGIIVKGGKNPGGNWRTVQTNDHGEFEFSQLDAGNYIFIVEQKIVIEDETTITVESHSSERKGWDGTVKGGSIADVSSERKGWDGTVKGGSITNDVSSERKGWDGTVKGNSKEIAEYLSTLNEVDQLLAADKKSPAANIRVAKENSSRLRSSIQLVETNGGSMEATETNFALLLQSMNRLGESYKAISNVLKTKHDTAKNSVGNIR